MDLTRRTLLQGAAVAGGLLLAARAPAGLAKRRVGFVEGKMTGAMAVIETLQQEGCDCVYGIPGAQETNCGMR
jgi:acetolactate synthase I/II/III large subunit